MPHAVGRTLLKHVPCCKLQCGKKTTANWDGIMAFGSCQIAADDSQQATRRAPLASCFRCRWRSGRSARWSSSRLGTRACSCDPSCTAPPARRQVEPHAPCTVLVWRTRPAPSRALRWPRFRCAATVRPLKTQLCGCKPNNILSFEFFISSMSFSFY